MSVGVCDWKKYFDFEFDQGTFKKITVANVMFEIISFFLKKGPI